MSLLPIDFTIEETEEVAEQDAALEVEPSRTWRINLETGRIERIIDDEDAIRQYIRKALMTSRNRFLIYDDTYGEELTDLIGHGITPALMQVEIPRLITEALIYDDRIESVPEVDVSLYGKDGIHCAVTVELYNGNFITEEVTL